MGWGLFKQMACKIVFNNTHNIHRKPNQINYCINTKDDSLENLPTKINQEVFP